MLLISPISAPHSRSSWVVNCFWERSRGGTGAGNKALAPPEKAQTTRSCSEAAPRRQIISAVPSRPDWSGMG